MKKSLAIFLFILISYPCYADVINPHFTSEQRAKIQELRKERYQLRQRKSYINDVCGDISSIDKKECKVKLKKEYDENLKILEKLIKENKKNASKNITNSFDS
ncbi:hypothetical protein IJG14_06340 [bacterium]|nr:hypothetical protein [bacterium]